MLSDAVSMATIGEPRPGSTGNVVTNPTTLESRPRRGVAGHRHGGGAMLLACMAGVVLGGAVVRAEPTTQADYDRQLRSWLEKKLRSDFAAHGAKDAAWADALGEYHAAVADALVSKFAEPERIKSLTEELVAAGCDDPVFLILRARLDLRQERYREARDGFRRQQEKLRKAGYPPLYALLSLIWTREAAAALDPATPPPPAVDMELFELSIATASDPDFADGNQRIYAQSFMIDSDAFCAVAADRFAKPDSGVDPWITAFVQGRDEIRKAWAARGSGFAAQVTPEGWKGLAEHLAAAREHLTEAHEMHPEFPEAAAAMISVSMGDGSGETRDWFDHAVAAKFDHAPAYLKMVNNVLLPRWGGSHEALLEFGRECLATGRFDTIVPSIYLDAVRSVAAELPNEHDVYAIPGVYEDSVKTCEGYLATDLSPRAAAAWKSRLVITHWGFGNYADACAVLDDLDDRLSPETTIGIGIPANDIVGQSRLRGGPQATAFAKAERLVEDGKADEALAAFKSVANDDGLHPASRGIVASRIAALETAAKLAENDWVDLQPPADLAGWRIAGGTWTVEADGTLVGSSRGCGTFKIVTLMGIGRDIEFTAEFDLAQRPNPKRPLERLCVMLAHPTGKERIEDFVNVRFLGPPRAMDARRGLTPDEWIKRRCGLKETNTLRIVLWDGKLTVFVNDAKCLDEFEVPVDCLNHDGLAIADYAGSANPVQVRIRKMRGRRLTEAPEDL